jgi:hypothetical protein
MRTIVLRLICLVAFAASACKQQQLASNVEADEGAGAPGGNGDQHFGPGFASDEEAIRNKPPLDPSLQAFVEDPLHDSTAYDHTGNKPSIDRRLAEIVVVPVPPDVESCNTGLDYGVWYGELMNDPAFPKKCGDAYQAFCRDKQGGGDTCTEGSRQHYEEAAVKLANDVRSGQAEGVYLQDDTPVTTFIMAGSVEELPPIDPATIGQDAEIRNNRSTDAEETFRQIDAALQAMAGHAYEDKDSRPDVMGQGAGLQLADGDAGGTQTEDSGSGRHSWNLLKKGDKKAQWFNADFSFGSSANLGGQGVTGTPESRKPTSETFNGLEANGDMSLGGTVLKNSLTVAKASMEAAAFKSKEEENKILFKFTIFKQEVWRKEWTRCNKPNPDDQAKGAQKDICKPEKEDAREPHRLQQTLSRLTREMSGDYHFNIGPVPLEAKFSLVTWLGYAWNINLDFYSTGSGAKASIVASFTPQAEANVGLEGGFSIKLIRAGVGGTITLLNVKPVANVGAEAGYELDAGGMFCPFIDAKLDYSFLNGKVYAYAEVGWRKFKRRFTIDLGSWPGVSSKTPKVLVDVRPERCRSQQPSFQ